MITGFFTNMKHHLPLCYIVLILTIYGFATQAQTPPILVSGDEIITGSMKTDKYKALLENKNIAVVANHTSLIGTTHLIDSLLSMGLRVKTIFAPEHGFRGTEDAGNNISNAKDHLTGIHIQSLYGRHYKPTRRDLRRIDAVVFDIQDVGVRFYTYISTLSYVMEACAENDVPLIVLDRPNPNGFYVDGPVLEPDFASFVGLHPVPIVYGMTIGEYALMVNGEGWLPDGDRCDLTIIPLSGYRHNMICKLPVRPSPNLPNWFSVYLYPSLALFEGTIMSVGRGTDKPFQIFGHPDYLVGTYLYKPTSREGAKNPKYNGELCYGNNVISYALNYRENSPGLNLSWLSESSRYFEDRTDFFNNFFPLLAGTRSLQQHIQEGLSLDKIRESWETDLSEFRLIRQKYLLYPEE